MPGPGANPVPPAAEKSPGGPARRRFRRGQLPKTQETWAGEKGSSSGTPEAGLPSADLGSTLDQTKPEMDAIPFLREALVQPTAQCDSGATPDTQTDAAVPTNADLGTTQRSQSTGTDYKPGTIHRCATPDVMRRKHLPQDDDANDMCRTGSPEPSPESENSSRAWTELPKNTFDRGDFSGRGASPADSEPAPPNRRPKLVLPQSQSDHSNVDSTSPSISPVRLLRGRNLPHRATWQPPGQSKDSKDKFSENPGEILITDSMSSPSPNLVEQRRSFQSRFCDGIASRAPKEDDGAATPSRKSCKSPGSATPPRSGSAKSPCSTTPPLRISPGDQMSTNVPSPSRVRNSRKGDLMSRPTESNRHREINDAINRAPQTLGPLKVTKTDPDEVPVVINIGGIRFSTSRKTLSRLPEHLRNLIPSTSNREAFFDRDPTHFRLILNFLRDGSCALPLRNRQALQEIRTEARFFGLADLVEEADRASKEAEEDGPLPKLLVSAVKEGFESLRGSVSSLGSINDSMDWEMGGASNRSRR